MHDDTADATTPESQDPLTSERNEELGDGVGTIMDIPQTIESTPRTDLAPDVPTAVFSYDSEVEPTRDNRPEPVSARIESTQPKSRSTMSLLLSGSLVAAILGSAMTIGLLALFGTFDSPEPTSPPVTVAAVIETDQAQDIPTTQIINDLGAAVNPTAIALKATQSIVTVTVLETSSDDADGETGVGSGSGVVMTSDGYIITNHHVIEGGDTFEIELFDGRIYEAELIGSDDLTDIAVLRINVEDLTPIQFGNSDVLQIGDPAVAIGNPLGQEGGASVTVGIISAFNRRVDFADETGLSGMIQTDAAINSGSSGGALLDVNGNLVGITSAIGVSQAGPEGIGYAIPVELVDRITAEIIETGDVAHPFLGVQVATYYASADDGAFYPAGGLIHTIEGTDSAAGAAGIQPGDVIVRIGDREIRSQSDLILAVRLYRVGETVTFSVDREDESMAFDVVLGQRPTEFQG